MDQHPYSPFRGDGDGGTMDANRVRAFSSPGARGGTTGGDDGDGQGVGGIDLSSLSFGGGMPADTTRLSTPTGFGCPPRLITAPTTPLSVGTSSHPSPSGGVVGLFPLSSPSSQQHSQQQQLHPGLQRQPISPPSQSSRSPRPTYDNLASQPLSTQRLMVSMEAKSGGGGAGSTPGNNGIGGGIGDARASPIGTRSSPANANPNAPGGGYVGQLSSPSSRHSSATSPIGTQAQAEAQRQQQQQQEQFLVPAQLAIPSISGDSSLQLQLQLQQQQPHQHQHQQQQQQQQQHSPVGDENRAPSSDGRDLGGRDADKITSPSSDLNVHDDNDVGVAPTTTDAASSNKLVKLFVGQVPKTSDESDLMPIFAPYGPIADVSIIRDRFSMGHRGCAFVTYHNADDAQRAMDEVHNNVKFDRSKRPLQVRVASEPGLGRPNESEIEHKLFVGMLSRSLGEREVKAMFDPYGQVKSVFLIRNQDGTRKGCAFVRMSTQQGADAAIDALSGNVTCPDMGRPVIVKYADTKYQKRARQHFSQGRNPPSSVARPGAAGAAGYPAAFGGVHSAPPQQAGYYQQQYQYTTSQAVAQQGGHGGGQDGGGGGHGGSQPDMSAPAAGGQPHAYGPTGPPSQQGYGMYQQAPSYHGNDGGGGGGAYPGTGPRPKEGPPGANLFIYHLPHDLTDADLATAFDPFGNVVSAKVYVDRHTGESKGFGFVSYDSVEAADSAIEQMNGFQIGAKRLKVQHKRVNRHGGGGGGGGPRPYAQQQQPYGGGEGYGVQYGRNGSDHDRQTGAPLMPAGHGDINALSGNFANLSTSNGMGGAHEETF